MACVINYKNNTYSLEDFKNVLLQDTSLLKEITKKSQERLNAIQEIFNQNPELSKIGDVFSYALYLDTIFPDSKVKDIVYRGGEKEDNRLFQYWTNNKAEAYMYAKAHITKGGNITERNPIPVIKDNIAKRYNLSKNVLWAITDTQLGIDGLQFEDLISEEEADKARELLSTNKDIKNLNRLIELYSIVKIESEEDLMKQFDDTEYQKYKPEYDKIRKELEPFFNRENIGKISTAIINITNPYKEEIVQEDLQNNRDAYKNGHDGAFLMYGDHFLVKNNTNQIQELGSKQDVEGFKKWKKDNTKTVIKSGIVPSIKGHAQFATDNGIGWFRSDDRLAEDTKTDNIDGTITDYTGYNVNKIPSGYTIYNKNRGWLRDATGKPLDFKTEKEASDYLNKLINQGITNNSSIITKNDKIIFGHPTIGKSYLKQKGSNDFITLDDDYANEVNAFIDKNRGSETRQEYKGRKPKEYNEFMLNLFDTLKVKAKKEGKRLFVSNTNILKERMSEFDKVITIPKDEFKKRFDARGATYGFEDWKSDIDATVAKVDKSKVISTTGYLSDLLKGNPKTRRILEVQSDLYQKGRNLGDIEQIIKDLQKSGDLKIDCN